jgi:hypothetical protein
MVAFFSKTNFFVSILIAAALIIGGIFSWQYRLEHKESSLSDQQIVWLLVGLLVIAGISMVTFLLILFGGIDSWH